jgi:hypothetical protein
MAKHRKEKRDEAERGASQGVDLPRLYRLVAEGDHCAARDEASRAAQDPSTSTADRAFAEDVLRRTAIDPGALYLGSVLFAALAVVLALLYLH